MNLPGFDRLRVDLGLISPGAADGRRILSVAERAHLECQVESRVLLQVATGPPQALLQPLYRPLQALLQPLYSPLQPTLQPSTALY